MQTHLDRKRARQHRPHLSRLYFHLEHPSRLSTINDVFATLTESSFEISESRLPSMRPYFST